MIVNTMIPTANPINLLGHICPLKCKTKYFTDQMYNKLIGILTSNKYIGYFSIQLYFMLPCSCKKVNT